MSGGSSLPVEIFAGLDLYGAGKTDRRIRAVCIRLWRILNGKQNHVRMEIRSLGVVLAILKGMEELVSGPYEFDPVLVLGNICNVREELARGLEQSGSQFEEGRRVLKAVSWYAEHGAYQKRRFLDG